MITGYGSTFNGPPDSYGEIVAPGAFDASLRAHATEKTAPVMLWSHNPAEPIGRWESIKEDAHGLRVTGKLELETNRGREAHALLKSGSLNGLSIGFMADESDIEHATDGSRVLKKIDLWEISLVSMPANSRARVDGVKHIGSRRELEELLRDAGLARAAARKVADGGYEGLAGQDILADQADEMVRQIKARADELANITSQGY